MSRARVYGAVLSAVALAAAVPLADVLLAQPAKPAGKKVALLVGVNAYQNRKLGDLRYAERDVTELAAVLKAAGFEVRTLTGAAGTDPAKGVTGRDAYFAALSAALTGVGKADTVLLGFSGHGVQLFVKDTGPDGKPAEKEVPFFCPADAVPTDPKTLVSFNDVLKVLDEKGGGHNLLLVDACRNVVDPNRGARGGINGTRIDSLPEGTAMFFSCGSRQRARETDKAGGGHGVFFHFVLEGMKGAPGATDGKGRVTWDRLVPYVKEQVKDAAAGWLADLPAEERQVPFAIGSLGDVPPLVARDQKAAPRPTTPTFEFTDTATKSEIIVPNVASKPEVVSEMLRLAAIKPGDTVYDVGCGDGRIVISAVKDFKAGRGLGIDYHPDRIKDCRESVRAADLTPDQAGRLTFKQGDALKLTADDFKDVDVVTLYLLPTVNLRLAPVLRKGLKSGARVVSNEFDMGDWKPDKKVEVATEFRSFTLYLWILP